MLFEKMERYPFTWSARREAAVKRRHQRELDNCPLFAESIKASQKSVEDERALLESQWIEGERRERDYEAKLWRKARAIYFSLPLAHRVAIQALWRGNKFRRKTGLYFADFMTRWKMGKRPDKFQIEKYGLQEIELDYCSVSFFDPSVLKKKSQPKQDSDSAQVSFSL
ncbi:TPA: hypothetical protein ACGSTL_001192 [Vibrio parahaemolyticus]